MNNKWIPLFALPDFNINQSIGDENIAIVPYDDSRIIKIAEQNNSAKVLLEKFTDQFGRKEYPSFLIINEDAPDHIRGVEAIVGFRNIVSIPIIIKGHEHSLGSNFIAFPLYSDYFNLYPLHPSKDGYDLLTFSPSLHGFGNEVEKFSGQTSPALAGIDNVSVNRIEHLYNPLFKVWQRRYFNKGLAELSTRALFRSLEMAYHASAIPFQNQATIYDYGTSVSLWVSAFEILSYPKNGGANLLTVLDLMENYNWSEGYLKKRIYKIQYGKKKKKVVRQVNFSQKLYKELYDIRNDFLHGNPIKQNRLRPFRKKELLPITRFAPLLYKVVLSNYLEQFQDRRQKSGKHDDFQRFLDECNFCEALLMAKKKILFRSSFSTPFPIGY